MEKVIKFSIRAVIQLIGIIIIRLTAEFISWGDFTYAGLKDEERLGMLAIHLLFIFIAWRITFKENFPLADRNWIQNLTNFCLAKR